MKKYRRETCLKYWNEKSLRCSLHTGLFEYFKELVLKPTDILLDIGCGPGRGGILFIDYLNKGNYFGFDINDKKLMTFFGGLIIHNLLVPKKPIIKLIGNFDISEFNTKFDFMIANSIFTHISIHAIEKCIKNVIPYLSDNGNFYASFWLSDDVILEHEHTEGFYRFSKQPLEFYKNLCKDICNVEYLGNRPWKTNQQLLRFYK